MQKDLARDGEKACGWVQARQKTSCGPDNPGPCYHSTYSHTMSQSASASRFESIFTSALDAYKKRTKKDLASHPLQTKLQSCDSADAIITLLREQIPAFSQSQSSEDRYSNCLIPTINVLCAFSAALGEGVGLVNTTVSSSAPRL
jgi:hypothetical protein